MANSLVSVQVEADLVIGLVGPVGSDLPWVSESLATSLRRFGYMVHEISISSLIDQVSLSDPAPARGAVPYDEYVAAKMTAGNRVCSLWDQEDALAQLAVAEIHRRRVQAYGFDPEQQIGVPVDASREKHAFILRSLKRVKEVDHLRRVYRTQFLLIGCHTPRPARIRQLAGEIAKSRVYPAVDQARGAAEELAARDEHEGGAAHGQDVRKVFPRADYFVTLSDRQQAQEELVRFTELTLGRPFLTPTVQEMGMFYARSSAVRSSDLSRQVGAAIVSDDGALLAVGCNEVPRAGGGPYWPGDPRDGRDFAVGEDSNQVQRDAAIREVFGRLRENGWLKDAFEDDTAGFARLLDETRIDGLTEFGRPVHAEMSAILDAARRGVSSQDATLYTTTFPCHNCAKHIVGAGVKRVIFVEPYPKSLAEQLHSDSIEVDPDGSIDTNKVTFVPFQGVSPSMYLPLFRADGKRKDSEGAPCRFDEASAKPKLRTDVSGSLMLAQEASVARACLRRLRSAAQPDERGVPPTSSLEELAL